MTNSETISGGSAAEITTEDSAVANAVGMDEAPVDLETGEATISDHPDIAQTAADHRHGGADLSVTVETVENEDSFEDIETGNVSDWQDVDLNPSSSAETTRVENRARPTLMRTSRQSSRWGVSQRQLLRTSTAVSLATGLEGGKETTVQEVTSHQHAMNPTERKVKQFFNMHESDMEEGPKHYRLTARPTQRKRSWMEIITGTRDDCDEYDVTVGAKAEWLTSYLRWTFRTSFTTLISFSCLCFMALSCAFAIAIHAVGIYQPVCIVVGDRDYNAAGSNFGDAFTLSWTTLSTVGYGIIYPNLAIDKGPRCLIINMFCTFESFCGVLFAGFMGAIIFGKVNRVQSFAPTTFSDPIVVRYGTGLIPEVDDDQTESSSVKSTENSINPNQIPCPVLEFRVANGMHSAGGGEIMNCSLNVVASVLESEASEQLLGTLVHKSHSAKKTSFGKAGGIMTSTAKQVGKVATGTVRQVGKVTGNAATQVGKATGTTKIASGTAKTVGMVAGSVKSGVGSVASGVTQQAARIGTILKSPIQEDKVFDPDESSAMNFLSLSKRRSVLVDEGSNLLPRRIFSQLEIDTPAHPFFKRVWNIRHVLDENSPLLSNKAKQMIVENDGYWPEELNNYKAIRENLHFHEVIVNLTGTANATGSQVYCQHVYSFCDVNIGYTFVNILHRHDNGKIGVDMSLLNDVVEQNGGGCEPFTDVIEPDFLNVAAELAGDAADRVANTTQAIEGHIIGATEDTAERIKSKAVHWNDMATGGPDANVDSEEIESKSNDNVPGIRQKKKN
jgi:hypothetical protein